jgi:hypothetical protein
MNPGELSKSAYARIKENSLKSQPQFPRQVRTGAFRINTAMKNNPDFVKNEKAFFLQSEHGSQRSSAINSRGQRSRDNKLANAGNKVMNLNPAEETESRQLRRAQKAFYLLPSSDGSSRLGSKHYQGKHVEGRKIEDQQQHLREITGQHFLSGEPVTVGNPYGNKKVEENKARKLDSSSSTFQRAKKAFYL